MTLEFSTNGYVHLLDHLERAGYDLITFQDLSRNARAPRFCVLRHDVDASIDYALQLAELEAARHVRSTYFLMVRSPLYNVVSRSCTADVRRIAALGHQIGLHFDARDALAAGGDAVESHLVQEMAMLGSVAGTPVTAFSFHQPTAELLARRIEVAQAVNAYTLDRDHGCEYVSDSNRDWRGRDVMALIEQGRPLQILLHPMWWICDSRDVHDCWDAAIRQNFERQQQHLVATEGAYGPPRRMHLTREPTQVASGTRAPEADAAPSRAYLAPLTDADAQPLFSWINDRSIAVLSAPFHPVHQPDHEAWFRDVRSRKDVAIFAIRRAGDGQLVGTCQLAAINSVNRSAELRIRIGAADARGLGLGTDACRALLRHAFDDLNLHRVYLHVLDANVAAKRLYEKVGFAVEGVAKDAAFIDGRWHDLVLMAIRRP